MAFYTGEGPLYELQVKVNPEHIDEALTILETTWKTYMPDRPFTYQFMDERFASLYQKEGRTVKLVLVLCILSILLSSLGLFGLVSFVAEGKTKEIGIRKSNGASVLDVVLLLSKSFIIWAFVAWILVTPVSWYVMTRWLEDFASRTAMSWWIFIVAGVTSLLVAAITVGWQSWRAARKNPIDALRYE
jgi:putative ABC transport system permease protein